MLNFFRKNTKPIIWTVVVAFVAWGGYAVGLQLTESNRAAGRLFGKEISFREYQSASEIIQDCSKADIVVYKDSNSRNSFVISSTCR